MVRNNWNNQLEEVERTKKRKIMTRYGRPKAVLVPLEDLAIIAPEYKLLLDQDDE
jgi:prevent-host-death family protein